MQRTCKRSGTQSAWSTSELQASACRRINPRRRGSARSSRERLDSQSRYRFIITITHFESGGSSDSIRSSPFSSPFLLSNYDTHPRQADKTVPAKSVPLSLISRRRVDLRWMMSRRVGQDVARHLCIIHSCNAAWRGLAQNWILMNLISNLLWGSLALCASKRTRLTSSFGVSLRSTCYTFPLLSRQTAVATLSAEAITRKYPSRAYFPLTLLGWFTKLLSG